MKNTICFFVGCCICAISLFMGWHVRAQSYTKIGYTQTGKGSYYADKFHGRKTASGEKYNKNELTAAHPKIPFNSYVRVTNLDNDKSVVVRINDRGPFSKSRIIDVSKAAALKLGMIQSGTAAVKIEVISLGELPAEDSIPQETLPADTKPTETGSPTQGGGTSKNKPGKSGKNTDVQTIVKAGTQIIKQAGGIIKKNGDKKGKNDKPKGGNTASSGEQPQAPKPENNKPQPNKPEAKDFAPVNSYSVWGTIRNPQGYGIQLGSYSSIESALEVAKEASALGLEEIYIQSGWSNDKPIYRILYGADPDIEKMRRQLPAVKAKGYSGAFLKEHYKNQ